MDKEIVLIASDCWFLILRAKVVDFKFCEIKAVKIVVLDQEHCKAMYSSKLTQSVVPLPTYVGTSTY